MDLYDTNENYHEYDYLIFIHKQNFEIMQHQEKIEELNKKNLQCIEKLKEIRQATRVSASLLIT